MLRRVVIRLKTIARRRRRIVFLSFFFFAIHRISKRRCLYNNRGNNTAECTRIVRTRCTKRVNRIRGFFGEITLRKKEKEKKNELIFVK